VVTRVTVLLINNLVWFWVVTSWLHVVTYLQASEI